MLPHQRRLRLTRSNCREGHRPPRTLLPANAPVVEGEYRLRELTHRIGELGLPSPMSLVVGLWQEEKASLVCDSWRRPQVAFHIGSHRTAYRFGMSWVQPQVVTGAAVAREFLHGRPCDATCPALPHCWKFFVRDHTPVRPRSASHEKQRYPVCLSATGPFLDSCSHQSKGLAPHLHDRPLSEISDASGPGPPARRNLRPSAHATDSAHA